MTTLAYYTDSNQAVLWWEKPQEAVRGWCYQVSLDDHVLGTSTVTHYTVENLRPDTEYTISVSLLDASGRVNSQTSVSLKTRNVPSFIDVTASPYYAKGDGTTLNTAALQRALDDCPVGGCVLIPAGTYRTGALRLHSDMELYLEENAVILGSNAPEDYLPRIHSRFEGTEMECYQSLLNLGELDHNADYNCRNVIIHGKGTIQGGGYKLAWTTIESERQRLKDYLAANAALVATCENNNTIPGRVRGRLINMSNCQNIRISGLTLAEGPSWNVHFIYSDQILTDHCTFRSQGIWNGDGWDPDSSTNCTIFGCVFYTGDDSVAIKSGKNPEGNEIARPTKHIRIFDCRCVLGHGLCMGSEMSGGIEDVRIWDCDLENSYVGIEVKGTAKRGGYVRNIWVRDCTVPCLLVHSVLYNDDGIPASEAPIFENYRYERVRLTGRSLRDNEWYDCAPIELRGFDEDRHAVKNVRFKDVTLPKGTEPSMEYCKNVIFE